MAVFKCKMCGASLDVETTAGVIQCEYCGSKQTLPNLDDERRASMYDRANHFRRNNEFDKAAAIFEQILNDDNTDAEAYWSLVLCKYGVEYVEDPSSRKRLPTIHRAQYTSVYDDENYKSALEYADSKQASIYKAEAKALNEIQKGILEISQNEDPFDVFICYKETDNNGRRTPDSVLANDLYHQLTQEGFKVFFSRITLEDKIGSAYEPYIFAALNSAKVMVVLGTKPEYFNAVWVKNEWSRFLSLIKGGAKKALIPAYKDMDAYDLPDEFSHLQAQDMNKLGFMQDLLRGIRKLSEDDASKKSTATKTKVTEETSGVNAQANALLERTFLFLEDEEWSDAYEYADKVLDLNPKCAKAYLARLMSDLCINKIENLASLDKPFDEKEDYKKFARFASESERKQMEEIVKKVQENKKAKEERENEKKYVEACNKYNTVTLSELQTAHKLFEELGNYKNSAALKNLAKYKCEFGSARDELRATAYYGPNKALVTVTVILMLIAIAVTGITVSLIASESYGSAVLPGIIAIVGWFFVIIMISILIGGKKRAREERESFARKISRLINTLDNEITKGIEIEEYQKLRNQCQSIYSGMFDKNGKIKLN